ncbi:MAG: pilus assembly protein PilM [Lachnospiraceae bacterium]|nr:pilus assembly protein PilM [Lachnospiraceae bacterium]
MSELLSIVLNNNIVRIALVRKTRAGTRVRRLLEKEVPESMVDDSTVKDPEAFAGFLKLQFSAAGIHARDAIFTMPADRIMTREVVLPDLSDARIRQIVATNAGEYFPIKLEEYVFAFYRIAAVRKEPAPTAEAHAPAEGQQEETASADLESDRDVELTDLNEEPDEKKKRKRKVKKEKKTRAERRKAAKEVGSQEEGGKKKRKERGEVRVMVVAAPDDQIKSYYDTAAILRLRIRSIDFIGNSVFRLAAMQVGKEPTLTVDISGDHTALTFFDSGDMIMQRNLDFGLDQIVDVVARERWVSAERADEMLRRTELINEELPMNDPIAEPLYFAIDMIRRTMMYYTRNRGMQPVEQVLLMGDAVYFHGVRELLEAQLSVPVTSLVTLKGVTIPRTATVREQAMRYLDNYGAMIAPVGLLSQELEAEQKKSKDSRVYRAILGAAALVSVALIAVPGIQLFKLDREVTALTDEVNRMRGADKILAEYEEAKTKNDDVRNVEGLTASNNDEFSAFIERLEEVRPRGVRIESFTIDEGAVSMTVLATGKDVIAGMLRELETIDNVSEVETSAISSFYDTGSETVSCTISCMLTSKEKRDYEVSLTQTAEGGAQ